MLSHTWDATAHEVSTVMHVRCSDRLSEEAYRQVLEQLAELSPLVQALPPSAALVELKGALGYHGADARRLGEVLRVRTLSRLGFDVHVGIGPSITVAATASGQIGPPGGVLAIDPAHVTEWLGALPVEALHGIGSRQAKALRDYGIRCVGLLAATPSATVQRLLGGRYGRLAADRTQGIDPRPLVPRALPASATVTCGFPRHTLDGGEVRAALLDLVVQLGHLLRHRGQAAGALMLRYVRRRALVGEDPPPAEVSALEEDLRLMAYRLIDAAGLQRGRLIGLILKAEDLADADRIAQQISLDRTREARLVAEGGQRPHPRQVRSRCHRPGRTPARCGFGAR
ncbi:DNA polymerase Y family protein [Streptomyces sp. NPDC001156]